MTTANKQKLPNFQNAEDKVTSLSGSPYPDNFHVGQAIGNGSCFFDSFRQSLEQQIGTQVTVEQLRNNCKKFAQNNPPEWFTNAIANSYDNNSQRRNETVNDYVVNIMDSDRWGDPDIEGRILCEKYSVTLHVVEDQSYFKFLQREVSQDRSKFSKEIQSAIMNSDSNGALAQKLQEINSDEASKLLKNMQDFVNLGHRHCLIDSSGSLPEDNLDYNDQSTIHIINNGESHFEPLLDINKSLAKQLQEEAKLKQEQDDFLFAKQLQINEILEYCNLSNGISKRAEVEKRFDELLKNNPEGKISDVVEQCVSDIKQCIQRSEEQSPLSLLRCGEKGRWIEKPFDQQQLVIK
ncbi:MAG: hypothetical protein ACEY3A_00295 [Wolbachia sp.]